MDTTLFREFVTLAELLNFSTAARYLNMSQSTLSRHIIELEKHYQTELFSRQDSLTLTYAGQILLEELSGLFAIEDRIEQRIREARKKYQGTIYVEDYQFSHEVRSFLLRAINQYRLEQPSVLFEFRRVKHNVGIVDSVREGYFNIGVLVKSGFSDVSVPQIEGVRTLPLPHLASRLALYVHSDISQAVSATASLRQFAEVPILLPLRPEYSSFKADFTEICQRLGFVPQFLLKEMHGFEQLALFDMQGCAQVIREGDVKDPSSPFLMNPSCRVISLEEELFATPYLIYDECCSELVASFIAFLRESMTAVA